jgi:UDP-glucose 4-epimerase
MRTVWITGAAGFLGGHAAAAFAARGWLVVGLGHAPRPGAAPPPVGVIGGEPAFIAGSLSPETLDRALALAGPPDAVIHAAGSGAVGPSFSDPLADFHRAVTPTAILLDTLRRKAAGAKVVLVSSAAVYGVQPDMPISEEAAPAPVSPYGAHKLAAEILCRQAATSFGQQVAALRFFSLYGPGLRKQLLWDLSGRLAARPETLRMAGTGDETRDMIHVSDAADMLLLAAEPGREPFTLVNAGTGRRSTVRAIAEGLARRLSPGTRIVHTGDVRAGDPRHLVADASKLAALGFAPRFDLDAGLDAYADWLRAMGAA